LAAFLDLPFPARWSRQFNVLENFTHEAIQEVKNFSQTKSVQDEVLETLNDTTQQVKLNRTG
jgi:hypothetical protein